ncbi:MAG: FAD binding domain-containing protein [Candidatus Cloacimonetes bacterium]|nr:FAD binding domain-containing protein [Candidatus Cloacimonadota bacterium]
MKNKIILSPKSIAELKNKVSDCKSQKIVFIAGCTDLLVEKEKFQKADVIINLSEITELNEIFPNENYIYIGSAIPISKIIQDQVINKHFPIMIQALKTIGSPQIRNRATLGGNLANASPAGDSIPPLMVLEAKISVQNLFDDSSRKIPITEFFLGPGMTVLKEKEFIQHIEIPIIKEKNVSYYFRKVGQRNALTISKTSLAGICKYNEKMKWIKLSAGSVSPTVLRLCKTENFLINKKINNSNIEKAKSILRSEIFPISDIRSNIKYRREVTGNLLEEYLTKKL